MLKLLLLPFTVLYHLITIIRNYLYDTGKRTSIQFAVPVINIGNLTVGGTGKTPHVEYLLRLIKQKHKVATLSRGYGRKTKGFILANEESSAESIGDEPIQFFSKYGSEVVVSVGENRVTAIPSILSDSDTEVIVLDDAFQHRPVKPHLNILLSDFNRPFYDDMILPSGRLRESRIGARRADIIVASKCPSDLSEGEMANIEKAIKIYSKVATPVFFSSVKYGNPISLIQEKVVSEIPENIYLLTGLANAKPLLKYVGSNYNILKHQDKRDHFTYSLSSVKSILEEFNSYELDDKCILTTEKDAVKLKAPELAELLKEVAIYYLPIEIYFLKDQEKFDKIVLDKINDVKVI